MLEVAKVPNLTLFSVRSPKSLTPAFSRIFPVNPIFFKILTTGTKGVIIPKSERNPDIRDKGMVVLKQAPSSQEAKYVFILKFVALILKFVAFPYDKVIFAFERSYLTSAMRNQCWTYQFLVAFEM